MEKLIADVEDYCRKRGITTTTFGRYAVNDGKWFDRLVNGGWTRPAVQERVYSYIADNPPEKHGEAV